MKILLSVIFVLALLVSCSQFSRVRSPASTVIQMYEFDKIFSLEANDDPASFMGQVFTCKTVVREDQKLEDSFDFLNIGIFPLSSKEVSITIGDGTNEGTADFIGLRNSSHITWSNEEYKLDFHFDAGRNEVFINAYILTENKSLLLNSSHICSKLDQ